jgi:hypothetical protein
MPGIRRVKWWDTKVGYQIPREHDIDSYSGHMQYCQSCFQVGVKSELKKRLYRVESTVDCKDSKLKLVAETVSAPTQTASVNATVVETSFLSIT